jgi:hypothetical protein
MSRPRDRSSRTTTATEAPLVVLCPFQEEGAEALFPIFADPRAMTRIGEAWADSVYFELTP